MLVQFKGVLAALGVVYLREGHRQWGDSLQKLADIGSFVSQLRCPWCIVGDWNVTPPQLEST
eukprot:3093080-Prorocentrum_lima.AAC.1